MNHNIETVSLADTAKRIEKELGEKVPEVKFRVEIRDFPYTSYGLIDVHFNDESYVGSRYVRTEITDKYQAADYNPRTGKETLREPVVDSSTGKLTKYSSYHVYVTNVAEIYDIEEPPASYRKTNAL